MFWGIGFANGLVMRLREIENTILRFAGSQKEGKGKRLPDVELMEWERRRAVREEAARRRWETR
jgi:hypothetical protein